MSWLYDVQFGGISVSYVPLMSCIEKSHALCLSDVVRGRISAVLWSSEVLYGEMFV